MSGHDVNGLGLMLTSEPLVRSGVTEQGRPWCVLEVSARAHGSPSSLYRLALWGNEEHNRALAPLLRPRMRLTVCGKVSEKTFTGRDGRERRVTRIDVKSAALEPVQPGLCGLEADCIQPETAPRAFELAPEGREKAEPEARSGMTVTLVRAVAHPRVTVPSAGPLAGISCRELKLYAQGPKALYVLHSLQPVTDANLIMQRLRPGMELAVSGQARQTGISAADGRTPVYDMQPDYFGPELRQKGLRAIDFQVHPMQEGIPADFKGSSADWYYARGEGALYRDRADRTPKQDQGGMER